METFPRHCRDLTPDGKSQTSWVDRLRFDAIERIICKFKREEFVIGVRRIAGGDQHFLAVRFGIEEYHRLFICTRSLNGINPKACQQGRGDKAAIDTPLDVLRQVI